MIGIYRITSPSGKIYIGQTWSSKRRFNDYKYYACTRQAKIYNSLRKYGSENHEMCIIHELPSDVKQEILDQYEILYHSLYRDAGYKMLNLREPGSGGKASEESKEKLRQTHKRRKLSGEEYNYPSKTVFQFSKDGELLDVYRSIPRAAKTLNISKTFIYSSILNKGTTREGHIFRYEDSSNENFLISEMQTI